MPRSYYKAGKMLQGRAGGGRHQVVVELPNEGIEDFLAESALIDGLPRLGEERIDGDSER